MTASFGMVLNQAPIPLHSTAPVVSLDGAPAVISLDAFLTDPEGDLIFTSSLGGTDSVAEALGGGLIRVQPTSDPATVVLSADDGLLKSVDVETSIDRLNTDPVILSILRADDSIRPNETSRLSLEATSGTGETTVISSSLVTWTVDDPAIASVTDQGLVIAAAEGSTIVRASYRNLFAATAITVGTQSGRIIEAFPRSYRIDDLSQTRQFQVEQLVGDSLVDLSDSSAGTSYIVGNPNIATINSAGLLTPIADGVTQVTLINGDFQVDVPITVGTAAAAVGTVMVDTTGATVGTSGGVQLSVGPGGLEPGEMISVSDVDPAQLMSPPTGFTVAGSFQYSSADPSVPFSVSIPAPSNIPVGDDVYLMEQAEIIDSDGQQRTAWVVVDHMVVEIRRNDANGIDRV